MTESHERILVVDDEEMSVFSLAGFCKKKATKWNARHLGVKPSRNWPKALLIWSLPT